MAGGKMRLGMAAWPKQGENSVWPTGRPLRRPLPCERPDRGAHVGCLQELPAIAIVDPFGRSITYLRVSVTDRCDLRCVYCMAEDMTFLPKRDVLSLEELDRVAAAFIRLGTTKLRITGGELVLRDVMTLFRSLGARLGYGLDELTLTTNGTQLVRHAAAFAEAGVRRVNVSLDTLDPERFAAITRWGRLDATMQGIFAARDAGLAVKINAVAIPDVNEDEFDGMLNGAADMASISR